MVKLGGCLFKGSIQGRMVIKSSFERPFQVCEEFTWDGLNMVKSDPLFSSIFFWLSCVFKWLKFESAFCKFVFAIVASASISACSCSLSLKKAVKESFTSSSGEEWLTDRADQLQFGKCGNWRLDRSVAWTWCWQLQAYGSPGYSFIDRSPGITLTPFQFLRPYSSLPFC